MTETNFPWSGTTTGFAGPYTADLFSEFDMDLMNNKLRPDAGVVIGSGDGVNAALAVQQTAVASTSVRVRPGSGFVAGRRYNTDDDIVLPVTANSSGNPRIDLVVLRSNSATQIITPFIIAGTPAAVPVAPDPVQSGSIWDIPLATIDVSNGFSSIVTADIDNTIREYHILIPVEMGGLGTVASVAGNIPVGNGVNSMAMLSAPSDYAQLLGSAAASQKMAWVGDKRPHRLRARGGGAIGTAKTLLAWSSSDWVNPSGFITALSANQWTMTPGEYIVWGYLSYTNGGGGNSGSGWWVAKSTTPTTAEVYGHVFSTSQSFECTLVMPPQLLVVSSGATLYEAYAEKIGAGTATLTTPDATLEVGAAFWTREICFERIK